MKKIWSKSREGPRRVKWMTGRRGKLFLCSELCWDFCTASSLGCWNFDENSRRWKCDYEQWHNFRVTMKHCARSEEERKYFRLELRHKFLIIKFMVRRGSFKRWKLLLGEAAISFEWKVSHRTDFALFKARVQGCRFDTFFRCFIDARRKSSWREPVGRLAESICWTHVGCVISDSEYLKPSSYKANR